jgi:hypothetical protein
MSTHRPHVMGFPAHNGGDWRAIGGVDFQQVKPYVLVGAPDPERTHLLVWLAKMGGVWRARLVHGDRVLASRSRASALPAVQAILDAPAWTDAPERVMDWAPLPEVDPYPANYARSPAGMYPDRPTAHDGRWDSRTGVI